MLPPNAVRLLAAAVLAVLLAGAAPLRAEGQQPAGPPQPPHAWLFGTWTGGLFPAPSGLTAQACLSQPVVIFTRDVVLRATLISELYVQRVIESARTGPSGTEFRFASVPLPIGANGLGVGVGAAPPAPGFGCESPDLLHVQRHTENEISLPGCADFPYPLLRCPAR
jgi:hypothetical protein